MLRDVVRVVSIAIPDEAVRQLERLAEREFRRPKEQATVLILEGLKRAGLEPRSDDRAMPGRSVDQGGPK